MTHPTPPNKLAQSRQFTTWNQKVYVLANLIHSSLILPDLQVGGQRAKTE
jgi:hypothetical protein